MSSNFNMTFNPDDVVWVDELPERPYKPQVMGRLLLFVALLKKNPGMWGKYPHQYSGGSAGSASSARKTYPEIEWEARGDSLYGRFPG